MNTTPEPTDTCGIAMMPDKRPWIERKLSRLFSWHDFGPDLPEWAKDGLTTTTVSNLCWKDRLRVLMTGNVSVRTWIACENPPGRHETTSSIAFPFRNP